MMVRIARRRVVVNLAYAHDVIREADLNHDCVGDFLIFARDLRFHVDRGCLGPGEPAKQVHLVDADVEDRAHRILSLSVPGAVLVGIRSPAGLDNRPGSPRAALVLAHQNRSSYGACLQELVRATIARREPSTVRDHQPHSCAHSGLQHCVGLLECAGHRLLTQDVLARLCRGNNLLGVREFGGADHHRINARVVEQPAIIHGPLATERVRDPFGSLRTNVGHHRHVDQRRQFLERGYVCTGSNAPTTNQSDAQAGWSGHLNQWFAAAGRWR